MVFVTIIESLAGVDVDTIVLFTPQFGKVTDRELKALDGASSGSLTALLESGEFCGKEKQIASIMCPEEYSAARVLLVGLGERGKINHDTCRRAAGNVSRHKGLTNSSSAAFWINRASKPDSYQALAEGYLLGSFKLLQYKTGDSGKTENKLSTIRIVVPEKRQVRTVDKAVQAGQIVAEGQLLVRTLAMTPPNELTPRLYAETARKLSRKHKLGCRVLDEKAIEKERMGALLSVSQGSTEPPRFVVLEHRGGSASGRPIVLVGKGVTFDTGGISLKKAQNMHEMKGDMAGSAVVLATLISCARLGVRQNVVGLIPMAENMPSGHATRPGDIVTSRKGLTIEVINTDAEGRMLLADALDYADSFKPQAVIDVATLTGAALHVLGFSGAPIMGNSPKLLDRFKTASAKTAERVWVMPIWDDFRDAMKSNIADLHNSGGAPGTMTAGAFLESFIGDWPWVHVDIAYVDIEPKGRPYIPKGVTGIGTRMFVQLLEDWKRL